MLAEVRKGLRVPELGPRKRKGDHEAETTGWVPGTLPGPRSSSPVGEGVLLGHLPPPLPNTHSFGSETTSFLGKLTGALGADSTPPTPPSQFLKAPSC